MTAAADFGRVGVLLGGWSAEREVSLDSGARVVDGLRAAGVDAHAVDVGRDIARVLQTSNFDRVFNILHGTGGEDGEIQGLLAVLQIPCTGSGVLASALAMDKHLCKSIWRDHGLPVAAHRLVDASDDADQLIAALGLPMILKPVNEGSSVGVEKIESRGQLRDALASIATGARMMAEKYLSGAEYTVAILDDTALPVIRLETPRSFYDYEAKYKAETTQYHIPSGLAEADEVAVRALALTAFKAIGAHGWGRVDLMFDDNDQPVLVELNTQPGMTSHSLVPKAAAAAGIDYESLLLRILASSMSGGPS